MGTTACDTLFASHFDCFFSIERLQREEISYITYFVFGQWESSRQHSRQHSHSLSGSLALWQPLWQPLQLRSGAFSSLVVLLALLAL